MSDSLSAPISMRTVKCRVAASGRRSCSVGSVETKTRDEKPLRRKPRRIAIGDRFGHLKVIYKTVGSAGKANTCVCVCDCGNEKEILGSSLGSGRSTSCGCRGNDSVEGTIKTLINNYRYNAERKGKEFSLTFDECVILFRNQCFYCGRLPIKKRNKRFSTFLYNGIDRLSSDGDYVAGNVVSCCEICNKAKRDLRLDVFLEWIDDLLNYRATL